MSSPNDSKNAAPVRDPRELTAYLAGGLRAPDDWKIGTEHEKFGFRNDDLRAPSYEGPRGIGVLLEGIAERFQWERGYDGEHLIALKRPDGSSITLEPAGQLELSGAQLSTLHQTCCEVEGHLREVRSVADELELGFLGMGFQPKWRREDMPWMPKGRYKLMREYMPKRGRLGLDMMTRTCTVQVNLDIASEADMVRKFRVSLALQPIATALFADSPFVEGKPSGFMSYRSHVWTDTDPDRCGMLPFVFEPGFGFERYVDYILDVPMYFAYRGGRYIDLAGKSFREFMAGKYHNEVGDVPRITDFVDHLTTAFPEVRMKRYLEMRGADGGPWGRLCALPALWVGLLYDSVALDQAEQLVKGWSVADHDQLRRDTPRFALKTKFRGGTVQDIAKAMVTIAREGLKRRNRRDRSGVRDESHFLDTLVAIAESGRCPAEEKLDKFNGPWGGSVDPMFREYAY